MNLKELMFIIQLFINSYLKLKLTPPKIQKATRRDRTKAKYRLKHPEAAKTETEQTADLSLVHKYVSSILGTYHQH